MKKIKCREDLEKDCQKVLQRIKENKYYRSNSKVKKDCIKLLEETERETMELLKNKLKNN